MKKNFLLLLVVILSVSCKKNHDNNNGGSATITGTWANSNWGGTANNIIKFSVGNSAVTGSVTELGSNTYGFSVGEVLYDNIKATGNNVYSATGTYHYGSNNQSVSHASAVLTLQNNGSVLSVQYSVDASTGITPPTYVYQRQ